MKSIKFFYLPARLSVSSSQPAKSRRFNGKLLKAILKHKLAMIVAAHALVIIALGYGAISGTEQTDVLSSLASSSVAGDKSSTTVDQVSSAELASQVAKLSSIVEANSVINQADSLNVQVDFGSNASTYLAKPQLIEGGAKSKNDITTYKTVAQDNVSGVAAKFGVSVDTIRWANSLQGEIIGEGKDIIIPPVTGVLHTVAQGDTPDSLAAKFKADKNALIEFNDAETSGLVVGERIVIPGGVIPVVAPVVIPTASRTVARTGTGVNTSPNATLVAPPSNLPANPISGGGYNGYATGYCTWHAANRRIQIGRPVPPFMGNAITWVGSALASGYSVGDAPVAGAVVWHRYQGGLGHVAFLEQVYSDGSLLISDMNYNGNWNRVTYRTEPASNARLYKFIY